MCIPKDIELSFLGFGNFKDILDVLKQGYFPNSKWFPLGIYLGLLPPTLKEIEANHRGDVGRCLIECLTLWLNEADKCGEFTPSWDSLADAVEKTGENITAKIIKELSKQIMNRTNHDFSLYE